MSDKDPGTLTGKDSIFIKLLVSAQPRIFGYIVTLLSSLSEAEEVMQETSIVMWSKFDDFKLPSDASEQAVDDLVAWGNQIAYFKVMNLRRRKHLNTVRLSDKVIQMISDEWLKQEQSKTLEKRRQALKSCIDLLPPTSREVIEDYYWRKSPVDAIAKRSQRSSASIYKLLQRSRDSLHKCIDSKLIRES